MGGWHCSTPLLPRLGFYAVNVDHLAANQPDTKRSPTATIESRTGMLMLALSPLGPVAGSQILIAYSATTVRFIAMWISAICLTDGASHLWKTKSMNPGTAAQMSTDEAANHAVKRDGGPRVARGPARIKSQAKENIQRPSGKATSMGWMGCPKLLAGVRICYPLLIARKCLFSSAIVQLGIAGSFAVLLRFLVFNPWQRLVLDDKHWPMRKE
ncbi:hypothetical protein D8I24_2655 (plasmid) [Cupriavidus necator H850]|nr:hypothetical protein D8I24_2655 [Cupriavidus necator H850]